MAWNPFLKGQVNGIGLEYVDDLYSYAMAMSKNRVEAEDLVQETYVRALQAAGRLKPDSNIKSWLFTILRNLWFNQLRMRYCRTQSVQIEDLK
jgi:RNA polymerase sigma-70 factor, ECF subfamily